MTNNKQQTAVEKYVSDIAKLDELFTSDKLTREEYFTKRRLAMVEANELHKEQIMEAFVVRHTGTAEQYYNETFGGGEQ